MQQLREMVSYSSVSVVIGTWGGQQIAFENETSNFLDDT
jgi:hypothetical protein